MSCTTENRKITIKCIHNWTIRVSLRNHDDSQPARQCSRYCGNRHTGETQWYLQICSHDNKKVINWVHRYNPLIPFASFYTRQTMTNVGRNEERHSKRWRDGRIWEWAKIWIYGARYDDTSRQYGKKWVLDVESQKASDAVGRCIRNEPSECFSNDF